MQNGYKQAGGTADVYCLNDIAELLVLLSKTFVLSTAEKLIRDLQLEGVGLQVFRAKIKNVVDCTALLSSKEPLSVSE